MQLEEPSIHQFLIDAPRSKPCSPSPPASHGSEFGRHRNIQIQMPATQQLPAFSYLPLMLPAVQLVFCDGGIAPRRKIIRCTIKRTSLITLVGAEETLAKTFPATENAPRSRLRICAQIRSWSVCRQHLYHCPDKLLFPFLDKKRRFRGSRFPRPASFVNLRTRYSPYFKLMGNSTPTNQQKRRPRRRRPP